MDRFIPFAAIASIDRWSWAVFLTVAKEVLLNGYARLPDGTVPRIDAAAAR